MLLKVPDTGPRRAFVHLPSCKHSVLVAQRFLIISFWNIILIKLVTKKLIVHLTIIVICLKCVCCNSCRAQDIYHQAAKQTFFFSSWSCNIFTKTTHFIAWREKDCGYFCYEMQCKQCYERNGIFLDILDLMEETFFWCNISQAVTLGLLLFCLEFRPCTALQTFFWVSLHFLLVSSIFWEGVNFPLGFYRYYAQKRRRLAFLLNISYWKPTSSSLRRLCRQRLWFIGH